MIEMIRALAPDIAVLEPAAAAAVPQSPSTSWWPG